ncbi:unnamed protein product, partial [Rotaria magnacalcarata]
LNMPTNESTVPIRILYNIAAPYSGPARTIGGVVIGYLGKYDSENRSFVFK